MSIQNITLNKETSLSSQNRILNKETSLSSQNITLSKETSLSSQNITLSKKKTTGVAANYNITGSEADLILFQVTGSSGSGLNGAIEVFGGEAGLIIANPNGISCNGCGFINTSKVDLVTGTANFSGDDLTGFSIDGSSTLNVSGSGFLSDSSRWIKPSIKEYKHCSSSQSKYYFKVFSWKWNLRPHNKYYYF